uniref:Uncharacterized protein n=1 Tax=Meloidogyne enterolobii TaxID=390850 RepID=A0A6V7X4T4_MELEN|nr:unnamed protein product [Meloidogyne enterolobii]
MEINKYLFKYFIFNNLKKMEKQQKINLKNNLYLQICLYFHFRLLPFILFSQIICFGIKVFFC